MTIEEGCVSLKLECALRELGFVEIGWQVVAHAGLFFVSPVGFTGFTNLADDLIGFQLSYHYSEFKYLRGDLPLVPSAKRALDMAMELS